MPSLFIDSHWVLFPNLLYVGCPPLNSFQLAEKHTLSNNIMLSRGAQRSRLVQKVMCSPAGMTFFFMPEVVVMLSPAQAYLEHAGSRKGLAGRYPRVLGKSHCLF